MKRSQPGQMSVLGSDAVWNDVCSPAWRTEMGYQGLYNCVMVGTDLFLETYEDGRSSRFRVVRGQRPTEMVYYHSELMSLVSMKVRMRRVMRDVSLLTSWKESGKMSKLTRENTR